MKKREKGFSLLEAAIALLLFGLILQSLLNFFSQMYVSSKRFDQRTYLVDNARAVNDFVREKIRIAEKVQILVGTAMSNDTITPIKSASDNVEKQGKLYMIQFKTGTDVSAIELIAVPAPDKTKGKYKLVYTVGPDTALISDMIEDIQVKRKKNSDIVEFTCSFNKHGETLEKLKVEETFTESLAYKEKY
ncbi:prepilin-type N-terminal cleavage/methylation domain-containing protein [Cellulosilyticum lentocellum]|uniref:Prepilin-type N-terminal cleavage/methylation domain-containing protein n=1 Tax=Cellulosilyticum lentocellum (strain ATCC 49066 / DSM 5427 / NCIMB 11756 / RHM5) TaxID=642492 RepID=F2JMC8_CELLD|nr:prepilin-type N-terminal cleavage/methylation domain-containing protein [Cellulosilyticum lentocellum]ADZ83446.1 hypothetical protein Clole_1722 [Cellulosilyticum lentocellum DSM 5427]